MAYKNILINSLKESFIAIWRNKLLFALLFAFQIVFFTALSSISYRYVPIMVEKEQAIEDYFSSLKLDEESVAASILQRKSVLGDDPLSISRNFNELVRNFKIYSFNVFVLLIFFLSVSWGLTHKFLSKSSFRNPIIGILKIFAVLLVYLGAIYLFFLSLLDVSFVQLAGENFKLLIKYVVFLFFSAVMAYFMLISIALLGTIGLREIVQKTLAVGIKKMHYILPVFFVNILLLMVSSALLFYFIEKNLLGLLLSIALLVSSFVFGRIFSIRVIERLS